MFYVKKKKHLKTKRTGEYQFTFMALGGFFRNDNLTQYYPLSFNEAANTALHIPVYIITLHLIGSHRLIFLEYFGPLICVNKP